MARKRKDGYSDLSLPCYEDDGHFTCIPFVRPKDRTPRTKEQIKHADEAFQEVLNAPPGYTNATGEEKRAHPDMFED